MSGFRVGQVVKVVVCIDDNCVSRFDFALGFKSLLSLPGQSVFGTTLIEKPVRYKACGGQ